MRAWSKWMALAGLLAGPWFALVLAAFAAAAPGYRHAQHPAALLGATGQPGALAFNLLGFVAAGVLALLGAQAAYAALRADGAGFTARIGATLVLLSALAFIAQGLFPLELARPLDLGTARIHIAAWNLWWMAAMLGALATALGARALPRWRSLLPPGLAAGVLIPLLLLGDVVAVGDGWRQRLALAAWFGWIAWAAWRTLRRGAQP